VVVLGGVEMALATRRGSGEDKRLPHKGSFGQTGENDDKAVAPWKGGHFKPPLSVIHKG